MKNLFKSLMLVAVAAMAFVACQNEPETNVNLSKKAILNVEAGFEQTRSSFVDEADAEAIKTVWDGNETIALHVNNQPEGEGVSQEYTYLYTEAKLTEGGEKVNFVAEFELGESETMPVDGVLRACAPYVAGKIEPTYNGFNISVPAEQTPEVNDVDPAAQVLYAEYRGVLGEQLNLALNFKHYAAYGKMTIKGGAEAESVVVKVDRKEYTLSSENVENGLYWFACEESKTPEAVKVTVNGKDGKSYSKELDLTKNAGFGFTAGRLSVFTVDMTGVEAGGDEYANATVLTSMTEGTLVSSYYYKFTFSDGANSTFSLVWIDWDANATNIQSKTYNWTDYVSYITSGTFALSANDTYMFNGVNKKIAAGSTVTVESEGDVYTIKMHFILKDNSEHYFIYNGKIGNAGSQPAEPVKLATPAAQVTATTTDSITVSWSAVDGASNYYVTCGNASQTVDATSVTFTGLEAGKEYAINITAKGDGTNYTDSDICTVIASTEAEQGGDVGGEITEIIGEKLSGSVGFSTNLVLKFTDATNSSNYFECTLSCTGGPNGAHYVGSGLTNFKVDGNTVEADGEISFTTNYDTGAITATLNITVDGKKYNGTTTFSL